MKFIPIFFSKNEKVLIYFLEIVSYIFTVLIYKRRKIDFHSFIIFIISILIEDPLPEHKNKSCVFCDTLLKLCPLRHPVLTVVAWAWGQEVIIIWGINSVRLNMSNKELKDKMRPVKGVSVTKWNKLGLSWSKPK